MAVVDMDFVQGQAKGFGIDTSATPLGYITTAGGSFKPTVDAWAVGYTSSPANNNCEIFIDNKRVFLTGAFAGNVGATIPVAANQTISTSSVGSYNLVIYPAK